MSENNEKNTDNQSRGYNLVDSILNSQKNAQDNNKFYQVNNQEHNLSQQNNNSKNITVSELQEMITKIKNNDFTSFKKLILKYSAMQYKSKNQLLNTSFSEFMKNNNENQKKIMMLLIEVGADPNCKISVIKNENNKTEKNNFQNNSYNIDNRKIKNNDTKISPIIYCLQKGDYELYEKIKEKTNFSQNLNDQNKNYLFYLLENNFNFENKYKILNDILTNIKNNFNLNDIDKNSGMTLLMLSVKNQNKKFVELLLNNNVDVNIKNIKDGNTALHYAAASKNKEIIELLLKVKNCNFLIKNNESKTIVDVASSNNCSTDIYKLLATKYTEQQEIKQEESKNNNVSQVNLNTNNNNNSNNLNINNLYNNNQNNSNNNSYMLNNRQNNNNENMQKNNYNRDLIDEGLELIKKNQVPNHLNDLNSYIEIPFSFNHYDNYNHNYNSDMDNNHSASTSVTNENNDERNNNIKNYLNFIRTPILNINLNSEEDENLLVLDNLKSENEKIDIEFSEIENKLSKIFNEQNQLLSESLKLNNDIKNINSEIEKYANLIQEKEKKNKIEICKIKNQISKENENLNILKTQENQLNLQNCHEKLIKNEEYLNNKFAEKSLEDIQIKIDLKKDILDFKDFTKLQIKQKQNIVNNIRNSLQQLFDENGYEYHLYVFGSYATGLCLSWSDLDLILVNKDQTANSAENSISKLQEIEEIIKTVNWLHDPILITEYIVFPFLTFSTDEEHGFMKVNLCIQDNKHTGIKCVKLTQEFLKTYTNLEPLVLVCKQLFKYANYLFSLSNIKNLGPETLNSYSILLMVISFLQFQLMGRSNIEMINNPENLGELFFSFMEFYQQFDFEKNSMIFVRTGINDQIENEVFYYLRSQPNKLIIIDPLNHMNNVSYRTEEFKNLRIIFLLIYHAAKVKCDCSCHYIKNYNNVEGNIEKNIVDLGKEHCILKKIFRTAHRVSSNYG